MINFYIHNSIALKPHVKGFDRFLTPSEGGCGITILKSKGPKIRVAGSESRVRAENR